MTEARIVDRRPKSAVEDWVFIQYKGKVYKRYYDARYFPDQIINEFMKEQKGRKHENR